MKIDEPTIDTAEDLDLVMAIYNLIEYSSNYFKTTGSLWFYSKHKATAFNNNILNTDDFKSFKSFKSVPLKQLSNFWRSLKMTLVNCKAELKLKWMNYCVLSGAGNDNTNASTKKLFSLRKTQNYMLL